VDGIKLERQPPLPPGRGLTAQREGGIVRPMRFLASCLTIAAALTACESTRTLVSTPAATPWPAGSQVRAVLLVARQPPRSRPNMLLIQAQATDSAPATDSLPLDAASASEVALLAGGVPAPLSAIATLSATSALEAALLAEATASSLRFPLMLGSPTSIAPLLPRSDGTQDLHFLIDQRLVRTFPATISVSY
jgi:hypothetical protein